MMKRFAIALVLVLIGLIVAIAVNRSDDATEAHNSGDTEIVSNSRESEDYAATSFAAADSGAGTMSASTLAPALAPTLAQAAQSRPEEATDVASALSPQEERAWRASLPTLESIRRQTAEDTHRTPRAILNAAEKFADLIVSAQTSKVAAREAFRKFQICAEDKDAQWGTTLKALCLANAKAIAQQNPGEFDEEVRTLERNLDPRTAEITQAFDRL